MANSFITTSNVDDSIPTIVAEEALKTLIDVSTLPRLVTRDYENEVAKYGSTINVTKRGALSVNDKSAGTDVTVQTPDDTKVAITLNKHKEITFGIDDVAEIESRPQILKGYMEDGVRSIAGQVGTDLYALYSSITTNTVDATSAFGRSELMEARRKMMVNGKVKASEPKYLMLDPVASEELFDQDAVANANIAGKDQMQVEGYFDKKFGFYIFEDNLVYNDTESSPTTYKNLALAEGALALVVRPLPLEASGKMGVMQSVVSDPTSGLSIRATMSYNHKGLGMLVTLDALYGVGVLEEKKACVVTSN